MRFVVPFAPGGSSEIVARSTAFELSKLLGQSVYVENKPGGAGNVAITDLAPQEEAHRAADQLREAKIRSVVINMEHVAFDQGLARGLAERMGAPCYTLRELKAESLYQTVKDELDGKK